MRLYGCLPLWLGFRFGGVYLAGGHHAMPDRQDRDPEVARRFGPRLGDLLRVPVALPGELAVEDRHLGEVERVVLRAEQRPEAGAVVERQRRDGSPGVLELVAAEGRGVPEDRDDGVVLPHVPTSA